MDDGEPEVCIEKEELSVSRYGRVFIRPRERRTAARWVQGRREGIMTIGPFEQLVFSGGGTRCFWHGGFLEATRDALVLQPARVSAASGGALSAACFIAGRGRKLLETMGSAFETVDHNLDLWDTEPGERLTPHQRIYREVVEQTLDKAAQEAVAVGPQFQVLLAHPPSSRLPKLSTFPLLIANVIDLQIRSTPNLVMTQWLGLQEERVDARQAARDGKLVDLICNAAVIPPVFNLEGWRGKQVIDGGLACKAPLPQPDQGQTLLLLTRRFRNLPQNPNHVYVEVSDSTPADKLDFTDREQLELTWEMGRRDGERFLTQHGLVDADA